MNKYLKLDLLILFLITFSIVNIFFIHHEYAILSTPFFALITIAFISATIVFIPLIRWGHFSLFVAMVLFLIIENKNPLFYSAYYLLEKTFHSKILSGLVVLLLISSIIWGFRFLFNKMDPIKLRKITLAFLIFFSLSTFLPHFFNESKNTDSSATSQNQDKRNFLFILIDGHNAVEGIPNHSGGKAFKEDLKEIYLSQGFSVFGKAYANYNLTYRSMGSMLNNQVFSRSMFQQNTSLNILERSQAFEIIQNRGYQPEFFQTDSTNFCASIKVPTKQCHTYPQKLKYLKSLKMSFSKRMALFFTVFVNAHAGGTSLFTPLSHKLLGRFYHLALLYPAASLTMFEDLRQFFQQGIQNRFVFTHVITPHAPFAFNKTCQVNNRLIWRPDWHPKTQQNYRENLKAYMGQARCVHHQLQSLFEVLKKQGIYQQTEILILADHGGRLSFYEDIYQNDQNFTAQDYLDHYSIFFAHKPASPKAKTLSPGKYETQPIDASQVLFRLLGSQNPQALKSVYSLREGVSFPYEMKGWSK